ncbi:MAG: DUF3644 domain-containing protein [Chloroflexi bacterium]|nr:DUF3644 domain-containing protein [Chloroflexota bacterium]
MKRLTRNLTNNSLEAFILALETINRPSVTYRAEAFCFLFCNAWELLMKAKLLADGGKIFYKKERNQPRRSFTLDKCLDSIFLFEKDPVKLNIKSISELRNSAMHLVIPFVPPDIMGLFQAGVRNYPRALHDWFGLNISDRVPLGMMALVYDFDPKMHSLEYPRIRRKLPAETVRWLISFQQDIRKQAESFGDKMEQFYIPIDLKLAIVKNPDKADIVLSASTGGQKVAQEAVIVEVAKDIDKTHPYRRKDVAVQVNGKLGAAMMTSYDVQCIVRIHGIRDKTEFYYKSVLWSPRYSEKFVDWIVAQATKNPDFFSLTRQAEKARQLKQNASKIF